MVEKYYPRRNKIKYERIDGLSVSTSLRSLIKNYARFVLLFLSLFITSISILKPDSFLSLKTHTTNLVVPVINTLAAPLQSLNKISTGVVSIVNIYEENQLLRNENVKLMKWQTVAQEGNAENASLRKLLNFAPVISDNKLVTKIITSASGAFSRIAIANAGTTQNVEPHMPVVSHEGFVGRVIEVNENNSKILLLTDPNSRIPVISSQSREKAILVGDNTALPKIRYINASNLVSIGEILVTAGDGNLLQAGLPIGTVVGIDDSGMFRVRPFVNWDKLENVSILRKESK